MPEKESKTDGGFFPGREEKLYTDMDAAMNDWLSPDDGGGRPVRICVLNLENLVSTISDLKRRVEVCEKNVIYALRKSSKRA